VEKVLEVLVENIDAVSKADYPSELREELIARNPVTYNLYERLSILDR
jgi:hypothetical protein